MVHGGGIVFRELSESEAVSTADDADVRDLVGFARIVRLDEGLYTVSVAPTTAANEIGGGLRLPATCVSAGPPGDGAPVRVHLSSGAAPSWIGAEGGVFVAQAASGGGDLVLTTYGVGKEDELPRVEVVRLRNTGAKAPAASPQAGERAGREIDIEMILHMERRGDQQIPGRDWVGGRGQRLRIEAFGIRPLEAVTAGDIQYMGFGPGGRRTPWVTDARLCGTRGRALPLTGFAVRLAPALADRFEVIYEGSFFASGTAGPSRNGEPCLPNQADDPLEAMRVRVIQRANA